MSCMAMHWRSGLVVFSLLLLAVSGCSELPPSSSSAALPLEVPEWPPGYEGRKPWNRNPETPKDNPAYKVKGGRVDVMGQGGPLFVDQSSARIVDWPKPKAALLLSGTLQGYIEPCGCAGLENMKGGLSRRHGLIKQLEADGWPLALLDQGELAKSIGPQAALKYRSTVDALRTMGYRNIGLGSSDLRLGVLELLPTLAAGEPPHFISANVQLGSDEYTEPFRVVEVGGMKISVTSVMLPPEQPQANPDIQVTSPAEGLKKILPKLLAKKCDQLVLMVAPTMQGDMKIASTKTRKAAEELARQFPQFDLMAVALDVDPPAKDLVPIAGTKTKMIELGHKGMYVGVVAFYDDRARPIRYQRVPLDVRFGESAEMKQWMASYQDQLRTMGFADLGLLPRPTPTGSKFVGSKTCADCHTKAYAIWKKTPHAHALETLEHVKPARQFDPECLSCHVTGWNAKEYAPYVSGYVSRDKTPLLADNGCENCHGPGSAHVAAEEGGAADDVLKKLRGQMRLTIAEARSDELNPRSCARCHDGDNSPEFSPLKKGFDHYWPKVEHKGKD